MNYQRWYGNGKQNDGITFVLWPEPYTERLEWLLKFFCNDHLVSVLELYLSDLQINFFILFLHNECNDQLPSYI